MASPSPPEKTYLKNNPFMQWLLLGAALLVLGTFIGFNLYSDRHQAIHNEEQRILTQTRVIARNMEFQLKTTNLALQGILNDLPFLGRSENFTRTTARFTVLAEAMPGIQTIFFTNAAGTILNSNRVSLIGKNISYRNYFTEPLKHPDPKKLYISQPFKTVLNSYTFNVSRMITGSDGNFSGVVTAGIDPEYFEVLLQSVLYAPDMIATINHGDGLRFMIIPQREGQAGKNLAVPGSMFTRHKQSNKAENIYIDTGYATSEYRMMALVNLNPQQDNMDKPPCIIAGRKVQAIMQPWQKNALQQGLFFLLICGTSVAGLLVLQKREASNLRAEQELAESRLQFIEEMQRLNEQLANQARIDFLTGIYNRLMFNELLQAELAKSCRYETPVSMLMFDLDHFKRVNDTLGHNTGDHVLQEVVRVVSSRIRVHDIFCRWGGEEFLILAPKNDAAQATQLAEILRELIAGHDFGEGLRVTASFGVTCHLCDEKQETFIERADAALYRAKHNGRNRVEVQ